MASSPLKSREAYIAEKNSGILNYDTQFAYALDLLRTKDSTALRTAQSLLEDGFMRVEDDDKRRECVYLIAIASTKMGQYEKAIECCDNLLSVNSKDHQASDLREEVDRRRRREGIIGASVIAGGAAVAVAGVATALGLLFRRS